MREEKCIGSEERDCGLTPNSECPTVDVAITEK